MTKIVVEDTRKREQLFAADAAPPAKRPSKIPAHVTHPDLWKALCTWLCTDADPRQLSIATAANLRRLAAVYVKAGEDEARVKADAASWYGTDWRGIKGQAPSVAQATDWRAHCRNGHAVPGRATEDPSWREDKPADPVIVAAVRAARIAGDSATLFALLTPEGKEAARAQARNA